ncbi:MAG: hypothetical protein Q9186_005389 [Xanthomendoza sp. 1 TL-2023]
MHHPFLALLTLLTYHLIIPITHTLSIQPHIFIPSLKPACWDHEDSPNFKPLVFRDCLDIIQHDVTRGHETDLPLKFSRSHSTHPDIKLPVYWIGKGGNKCMVAIDFGADDGGFDRTTMRDVKAAAASVARDCVIGDPHLGGLIRVGWHEKLRVMVAAVPSKRNVTADVESE